jgi:GNAT superfamily N-acetyltransferase
MSVALSIRTATPADTSGILDCLRQAFAPYREQYTPDGFADTVLSADTIERRMGEMSLLVAVDEHGEVVGTVGWKQIAFDVGHLRGMAVRPDRLGSGIAQALLDAAELAMHQRGCVRITLGTTVPLERAIRFYERNGYRQAGEVRDFFGMPLFEYVKVLAPPP